MAQRAGVPIWAEAFADRGYRADGSLVARGQSGALLTNIRDVLQRVQLLVASGTIQTVGGRRLGLRAQTICVHSDTPRSVALARGVAKVLGR